ncbi:hypothetical protein [uncultured Psychroserpens sp.]|nr:hypothetical protein [uncultured Psychroserpens sp.]
METLVATILIIVIFMVASMILNNLFSNSIKNNTRQITAHLNELEYLHYNEKLSLPYQDDYEDWTISVTTEKEQHQNIVLFSAFNAATNTTVEISTYR